MYDSFSFVYDQFMEDVPYKDWCHYLTAYLHREGIYDGLVLDLGCGTGTLTMLLAAQGYDMIGVDSSETMLQAAMEKTIADGSGNRPEILWLQQDMRSFELYGTVRAIVSACDSMNYILEEDELLQVFSLANNYLDPGGVFLFDMNTAYKYREILGDATFAETRPDCAFIWENSWFEDEQINQYDLTLFIRDKSCCVKNHAPCYERFDELHIQRAWSVGTVRRLLSEAGMDLIEVLDAYTGSAPSAKSERILFAAREKGKRQH